jgi:hypothetical protein
VVQFAGGFVLAAMGWGLLNNADARATVKQAPVEGDDGTLS